MRKVALLLLPLLVAFALTACESHPTVISEDDWGARADRVIDEVDRAIEHQNELYEEWGLTPEEIQRRLED